MCSGRLMGWWLLVGLGTGQDGHSRPQVQRQTRRGQEGDADRQTGTHTHTHTRRQRQREGDTERLTDGKPGTDTGEKMASDLRQTHWHRP